MPKRTGLQEERRAGDEERFSKPVEVFDEGLDSVDVPVLHVVEEVFEAAQMSPERTWRTSRLKCHRRDRGAESIPAPLVEDIVTGVLLTFQERDQDRIAAQRVHIFLPQTKVTGILRERDQDRIAAQAVDIPVPSGHAGKRDTCASRANRGPESGYPSAPGHVGPT